MRGVTGTHVTTRACTADKPTAQETGWATSPAHPVSCVYVPKTHVPPHAGQIAAAKLIMKRHREGKSRLEITPKIRYLANYEL